MLALMSPVSSENYPLSDVESYKKL